MLYKLNVDNIKLSAPVGIKTPRDWGLKEKDIETFFKDRLREIVSEDQLMRIGQERKFQEEADLLALDKDGVLYIFELKRWKSNQENILQVMRYGQIFGRYTYKELEDLARRQLKPKETKLKEIWSLQKNHQEYFGLEEALPESRFNADQVFVLVTNGVDRDTISAVHFWSQKGVNIECSPYRIYEIDGKPYIQFDTYNTEDEVVPKGKTRCFIVNTNKTYMPDVWEEMISEQKASAYYDRKYSINNIPSQSRVYLYHTGVGVIAKGISKSTRQINDEGEHKGEEFFVSLDFEWKLEKDEWNVKAPTPREINYKLNSGHRFRQTVFAIPSEMAKAIDSIFEKKKGNSHISLL